jgi:hypothetical protein
LESVLWAMQLIKPWRHIREESSYLNMDLSSNVILFNFCGGGNV